MSIQQNFPAITPSLSLNFARSKKLDPRITFTRTSSATRINERGLVEVVPANSPRFDHSYDSVSGSVRSLGLLVEEQRTNLLTSSNNFGTDSTHYGITASAAVSPDGATNASKIFEKTTTGFKIYIASFTAVAGTSYCGSVFVKAGERETMFFKMTQGGGAVSNDFAFNMNTGDFTASGTTRGAIYYGNGWWRIYSVITPTVTNGSFQIFLRNDTTGSLNYEGDGSSGFYIYGAQVEQGSFPTSYIPTTNSTVTRTADNVSMVGENFSSWYNPSEGTVYADTRMVGVQTARFDRLWAITNSNLNLEGISVFVAGPAGTPSGYVSSVTITNSATEQVGGALVETALTTPRLKSAFAFKQNDCASAYNGQQRFVDSIVDLSTFTTPLDRLFIGQPQRFQGHSCMTISQLTYYPRRLTNSQLTNLTK